MSRKDIFEVCFKDLDFAFDQEHQVFRELTFEFPQGEFVWLQGPSGSGRSTILQIMAGLLTPQAGCYQINKEIVSEMSFEEFLPYRLNIGYSFDMGGLLSNRTLYENLILPLLYHKIIDVSEAHDRACEALNSFGIYRFKDLRPTSVSGGTKKLVCVLRSMIHEPQMLLLDDPSVGLSAEAQTLLIDRLLLMKQQGRLKHVFLSSIDERFVASLMALKLDLRDHKIYREEDRPGAA